MKQIKGTAERDAIRGMAVERVESVDGFVLGPCSRSRAKRRELVFGELRGNTTQSGSGDQLGIATPGVVAGVHPALEIFELRAVDGKVDGDTMLFRLDLSKAKVRSGRTESPEKRAEVMRKMTGRMVLNLRRGSLHVVS